MNKKRILVVDDEPGLSMMVKLNLEKTGQYLVQAVNQSSRAMETARAFNPDLILMDITMPGMDGAEVASRLRADRALSSIPVVFLTAVVSQYETGNNELRRGGQVFLSKPVNLDTLMTCIEQHTRK